MPMPHILFVCLARPLFISLPNNNISCNVRRYVWRGICVRKSERRNQSSLCTFICFLFLPLTKLCLSCVTNDFYRDICRFTGEKKKRRQSFPSFYAHVCVCAIPGIQFTKKFKARHDSSIFLLFHIILWWWCCCYMFCCCYRHWIVWKVTNILGESSKEFLFNSISFQHLFTFSLFLSLY